MADETTTSGVDNFMVELDKKRDGFMKKVTRFVAT